MVLAYMNVYVCISLLKTNIMQKTKQVTTYSIIKECFIIVSLAIIAAGGLGIFLVLAFNH